MPSNQLSVSIIGCGWLGLPLAAHLVQAGYAVKGSTTTPSKLALLEAAGIEGYRMDAGDALSIAQVSPLFRTTILILALPPNRAIPLSYPRQAGALLTAAQGSVERVLYISSTGVYPDTNGEVTEATPPHPASASGKAILETEQQVLDRFGKSSTVLRLAGLAGPGREPGRFFAGRTGLEEGDCPVNFLHLDDCIGAIAALIRQEAWGELFNVCADRHPRKRVFYPHRARLAGFDPPTYVEDGGGACKIVSNAKIKAALGFAFRHPDPMDFPAG